jgi:hypothetical protein
MTPHPNHSNLSGQKFGRLTAVSPHSKSTDNHIRWLCRCECGKESVKNSNSLKCGSVKSCGCLRKDASLKRRTENGVWNEGKSYSINRGEHCYKTRHSWAKAVVKYYGNKCQACGWNKARCDAHHVVEKAEGGTHTISNGRVLCPNCHRIHHESP